MSKNRKQAEPVEEVESEGSDVEESDSVASESEEDDANTGTLKEKVTAYVKIDDLIREKKDEIKELNDKKTEYEAYLMEYLEKKNKTRIETKDGEIVYKQSSTKAALKEELIEKAIVKKFHDTKKVNESGVKIAHDILEEVDKLRGVTVKNSIRRIKKKTGKASKK